MVSKRKIESVIFDLGETLLIFGKLNRRALFDRALQSSYAYLKELSQPVGSYRFYRLSHAWGIRWHLFRSWITGDDFNSLELLKSYGLKKKFSLSDSQWAELSWRWYQGLSEAAHVEPGTAAALQQLHEMGLKVGLLSNTFVHGATLERHLKDEGLLQWLPERFYSYDFDYRKPDARIFTEVAEAMGVVAERTIYVGDRVDNDLNGSLAAGMLPVLKKAYTNEKVKIPANSQCIKTIAELPEWIRQHCELPASQEPSKTRHPVCK
ncbi:MAG: HAD family hydrolase [Planctomycetota bacterium]|jgi:HAD superfamily hydrolase (TIGR01549 family)